MEQILEKRREQHSTQEPTDLDKLGFSTAAVGQAELVAADQAETKSAEPH